MADLSASISNQLAASAAPAAPTPAAPAAPPAVGEEVGDDRLLHTHITRAFTQYLTPEQTSEIRTKYSDLRFPTAQHIRPNASEQRAALFGAASYAYLEGGDAMAQEALDEFAGEGVFKVDPMLSNSKALVIYEADSPETAYVHFRGRAPGMGVHTERDNADALQFIRGGRPDLEMERKALLAAKGQYSDLAEVSGYSLGGAKTLQLASLVPEADVVVLNPLIGSGQTASIPEHVQISRTVEDYVSGPGTAVSLSKAGGVKPGQIRTMAALRHDAEGYVVDAHSLDHWLPGPHNDNSDAQIARRVRHVETQPQHERMKQDMLGELDKHAVMTQSLGLASGVASGYLAARAVDAVGLHEGLARDAASGATASVLNQTIQSSARSALSGSVLLPSLSVAGPEMFALAVSSAAGGAASRVTFDALERSGADEHVAEAVSTAVGGAVGGGAFVAGTEAVVAAAGVAAALLTGGELGAISLSWAGPAGIAAGAALGAGVGLVSYGVSEAFHGLRNWWRHRH